MALTMTSPFGAGYTDDGLPIVREGECPHGEPKGPDACAFCRRASARGRDEGSAKVEANNPDWSPAARAAIYELARSGIPFTAQDLINKVGMPPGHPNAVGAAILAVAKTGMIYKYGDERAGRATRHRGHVTVWRGSAAQASDQDNQERFW